MNTTRATHKVGRSIRSTFIATHLVLSPVILAAGGGGAFDGGGGISTSASYTVAASLGSIGGASAGGSVSNSGGGTVTQPSVKSLSLNASPASINQGATSQLGGVATMDDDSITVLSGTDISWGSVTYPIQSVASNGVLLSVANVYATAAATVNGSYDGVPGSMSVQVLGPYASAGIPDAWFIQYFGAPPNPNAAPDADADGTGQNNLFKWIAGLNPINRSVFAIAVSTVPGQSGNMRITFSPLVSGRSYIVQFNDTLLPGNWQPLNAYSQEDNGATRTITDNAAPGEQRFYRVQITAP